MIALAAVACSPAAAPVADTGNQPVAPAPVQAEPVAPEQVVAGPMQQAAPLDNVQGANMQGGNDAGGQQAGERDPRMVGTWVNEKQINSPGGAGGFASFSTVMTMHLNADGTVQQFTQSVGGGGDWSSNSGRTLDFEGQWRTANGQLLVYAPGLPDFTPVSTYGFSGEYMVTNNQEGRLIWQKR